VSWHSHQRTSAVETVVHVHCLRACVASKAPGVECLSTHLFIEHASSLRVRYAQSRVVLLMRSCFGNQRTNDDLC